MSRRRGSSAPASKGDWGNLRTLIAGAEIRVIATGHEVIRGTFRSVSDDALIVDQTSGEKMLPRSSVISVSLKKQSRRIGYVSIGAIAGVVTGLLVDWPPRCCYRMSSKVISTPLGALTGIVIGAAIPTVGWREMYRMR